MARLKFITESQSEIRKLFMTKSIAILGTASNSGKTLVVTSLCKALTDMGYNVVPFKAVNITSNLICSDGIFAPLTQHLQTIACNKRYNPYSCPILFSYDKQICSKYINGVKYENTGTSFIELAKESIREAYISLLKDNDFVIVEGSGAAVEPNVDNTLANFFIINEYNIPTVLVSDIQYGGAFAALVGTVELLNSSFRSFIKGYDPNKFVGDKLLLRKGVDCMAGKYNLNCLGILNWIGGLYFPSEDSLNVKEQRSLTTLDIDKFEYSMNILAKEIEISNILKNILSILH